MLLATLALLSASQIGFQSQPGSQPGARESFPTFVELPKPLPMPSADLNDSALALAEKISKHTPDSGSALVTALQACGYSIIGKNKQVLVAPLNGNGNGMSFNDFEVLNLLNFGPRAPSLTFKSVSDCLGDKKPTDRVNAIHQALVDDLRADMKSRVPEVEFMVHFFDDLSQLGPRGWSINGPEKIDDLSSFKFNSPASNSPLAATELAGPLASVSAWLKDTMAGLTAGMQNAAGDPQAMSSFIQKMQPYQQLMVSTMQAGLAQQGIGKSGLNPQPQDPRAYADCPMSELQFQLILRKLYVEAYARAAQKPSELVHGPAMLDGSGPDLTGNVMDVAAGIAGIAFGKMWTEDGMGDISGMAANLGVLASFVKTALTFMCCEISLTPSDASLTRNKDTTPGAPQKMTLKVELKFKYSVSDAAANTMRVVSWATGGDVAPTINDGPISGAHVNWSLNEDYQLIDPSVWFVSPGQAGDGQLKISDTTDDKGQVNSLAIQTTPQKKALPLNAVSYDRTPTLTAAVDLKGSNLPDAVSLGLATLLAAAGAEVGDEASAMIKNLVPDMLMHQSLLSTKAFKIKVTDWTIPVCEGKFNLYANGQASQETKGQTYEWQVAHTMTGKLVSGLIGLTQNAELMKRGQGPYGLKVDSIRDVDIHDVFRISGKFYPDDCLKAPKNLTKMTTIDGPVAEMGYGYNLTGGSLGVTLVHVNGTDQMKVVGDSTFSFPCRFRASDGEGGEEEGIQCMNVPIHFEQMLPPAYDSHISGMGTQDIPFSFGTAKGTIHCMLSYDIHPVKKPAGK